MVRTTRLVYTGPDATAVRDALRAVDVTADAWGHNPPCVTVRVPWCDALSVAALADRIGSGLRLVREVCADTTVAPARFEVCA